MLNSIATRAPLCAMLCCVLAVASIPSDELMIRVGGAESIGPNHYAAAEKTTVSLSVHAGPGDIIWVYALAIGSSGQADQAEVLTLILDKPADGVAYGEFSVPAGLQGRSFELHAMSVSLEGRRSEARPVRIDVLKRSEPTTDPAPANDSARSTL